MLLDTFEALCTANAISRAKAPTDVGPIVKTYLYDLDKDGVADLGITVKTEADTTAYNLVYVPGHSISGDWCIDVAVALGDAMSPAYYSTVKIDFPIKAVSLTMEAPVGGTEVTSDEYWNQTNTPVVKRSQQEIYVMPDILAWWVVDEDASAPFSGTIEAGKDYLVQIQIETVDGRDFDDRVQVSINGAPPIRARKDEDQLFLVIALAKVRAVSA